MHSVFGHGKLSISREYIYVGNNTSTLFDIILRVITFRTITILGKCCTQLGRKPIIIHKGILIRVVTGFPVECSTIDRIQLYDSRK